MKKPNKQPKMIWFKWRQKYSYGYGDWRYECVHEDYDVKTVKDFADYIGSSLDVWSEQYRGVEVKKFRKPPKEILLQLIQSKKSVLKWEKEELDRLQADMEKFYPKKTKK